MKPITVALEVKPNGEVVREAFTMVHKDLVTAEQWQKDLPRQFKNGTYETAWGAPRRKKAKAILSRGNVMKFQTFIFGV